MKSKYHVVETTDLRTREKSYKIILRNSAQPPVVVGLATREEAEAKLLELEESGQ
jgi:hypothetical protein